MTNKTLDALIWICMYAGLFGVGLGIWFAEHHLAASVTLIACGIGLVGVAAVLIWLRSLRS